MRQVFTMVAFEDPVKEAEAQGRSRREKHVHRASWALFPATAVTGPQVCGLHTRLKVEVVAKSGRDHGASWAERIRFWEEWGATESL